MLPDPSTSPADDSGDPGAARNPVTTRRPMARCPPPEWPEADLPGIGQPGAVYPDAGSQGLFLSVPAGSFDADRFAQCGPAAEMPPDPLLATIIDAVTGPDGPGVGSLSDDQLIGVIAAVRRLESRVAWYALTAVAEFARPVGRCGRRGRVRRRPAGLRAAPDVPVRRGAAGLRHGRGRAAAAVPGRAARRPAAPGAPADHRGGNPDPVRGGRRCRGCGAGGDGGGADVREAAVSGAPDGPEPGSRTRRRGRRTPGGATRTCRRSGSRPGTPG